MAEKITLGVTGFSRAGKTVFIGSLAHALLSVEGWLGRRGQGPLRHFAPFERGQFIGARIRHDIHPEIPHFPFRETRDCMLSREAHWPEPTEGISTLVIDLEYRTKNIFRRDTASHIQLELIDYPGEWLIDLPMLEQTYAEWSEELLTKASVGMRADWSAEFINQIHSLSCDQEFDEDKASKLADIWADYIKKASEYGCTFNQPGRLLRPDTLRHSPILRLFPVPAKHMNCDFGKQLEKRFEDYKKHIVRPFYKNHFSRIDRQIVLIDILRTVQLGEMVFDEMEESFSKTLKSFSYGESPYLSWIFGKKISHILFAATKADHVIRGDRANLEQILKNIIARIDVDREFRGSAFSHKVLSLASVCATEDRQTVKPPIREILYGQPEGEESPAQFDPGGLPLDMPPDWPNVKFDFLKFEPMPSLMGNALTEGFPAINLGRAIDYLIGDKFK